MVAGRHTLIYILGVHCCGIFFFYYNYTVNVSNEIFRLMELFVALVYCKTA